jgi:hypothetical protein
MVVTVNLPVLVGCWSGYWSGVWLAGAGLVLSPVSGWLVLGLVSGWLIVGLVLRLVSGWLVLGLVTRPDLSDWYCQVTRLLGAGPRTKLHTYLLLKLESVKYGYRSERKVENFQESCHILVICWNLVSKYVKKILRYKLHWISTGQRGR